jgi:hypothetical protein
VCVDNCIGRLSNEVFKFSQDTGIRFAVENLYELSFTHPERSEHNQQLAQMLADQTILWAEATRKAVTLMLLKHFRQVYDTNADIVCTFTYICFDCCSQ